MQFYPYSSQTGDTLIDNNQLVDLVATREADGTFKAYFVVNGVVQVPAEIDVVAGENAVPSIVGAKPRFGFFFDDTATSSEATSGGKVYSIKIWDGTLTAEEIQEAMNPKATVADVTISGAINKPITEKNLIITLADDTIKDEILQDTDLSEWITNLPDGLSAKVKTTIIAGAASFTLEVYGTTTASLSAPFKITVPADAITSNVSVSVSQNPNAKFGISPYTVTYNGNSNTGDSVPVDVNMYATDDTVTVLDNTGDLVKIGYIFGGWNTRPDGSGTSYSPDDTFTMDTYDVTLYAEWITKPFRTSSLPWLLLLME